MFIVEAISQVTVKPSSPTPPHLQNHPLSWHDQLAPPSPPTSPSSSYTPSLRPAHQLSQTLPLPNPLPLPPPRWPPRPRIPSSPLQRPRRRLPPSPRQILLIPSPPAAPLLPLSRGPPPLRTLLRLLGWRPPRRPSHHPLLRRRRHQRLRRAQDRRRLLPLPLRRRLGRRLPRRRGRHPPPRLRRRRLPLPALREGPSRHGLRQVEHEARRESRHQAVPVRRGESRRPSGPVRRRRRRRGGETAHAGGSRGGARVAVRPSGPSGFEGVAGLRRRGHKGRMEPPLGERSFGNLCVYAAASEVDAGDGGAKRRTAEKLRNAIKSIDEEYLRRLQGVEGLLLVFEKGREAAREHGKSDDDVDDIDIYYFNSWARFPVYGVDFGWGKPVWVGVANFFWKNLVLLMGRRGDRGMEAWVTLEEEEMVRFEKDQELVSYAASLASIADY